MLLLAHLVHGGESLWHSAWENERAMAKALLTKDVNWFDGIAAPDFYGVDEEGTRTNRAETLQALRDYLGRRTIRKIEPGLVSVVRRGEGMVVRSRTKVVAEGRIPIIGATITRDAVLLVDEVWTKIKGKWRLRSLRKIAEP